MQTDAVAGAILGCAVGDALGLPYENLSRRRGVRLLGEPDRHRFLPGRGMVSDDTEHTGMVAQALCRHPDDAEAFAKDFGRRLRWWLAGVPAGIGIATLKATCKLWLGFPPSRSGVFSAGNGPAMRSAVLGAAIDDLHQLAAYVRVSTILTHTDPKAFRGAFAVALAAWCAKRGVTAAGEYFDQLRTRIDLADATSFNALLNQLETSLTARESTADFAVSIGCVKGVSGYIERTVPVVLHAWLTQPTDYAAAVQSVICCGGDTDTTAAIVGAIIGSGVGRTGIPEAWRAGLWEWPRTEPWMARLGEAAAAAAASRQSSLPPTVPLGVGLLRNALFLMVVIGHVLRRALPPY